LPLGALATPGGKSAISIIEQAAQFNTGLCCAHEGFAHQEGVDVGVAHALDVIPGVDSGFGHDQFLAWYLRQ
jgi:hypothetical protein